MVDSTLIAAFSTAILAPVLGYLKVREERLKTAEKRDAQNMLLEKRLQDVEKKCDGIEELKESINTINLTLTKIQTILEMYIKQHENK